MMIAIVHVPSQNNHTLPLVNTVVRLVDGDTGLVLGFLVGPTREISHLTYQESCAVVDDEGIGFATWMLRV